ncbi:MAG: hypothetical protein K2Y01_07730 [Rhabdochlamydiaceae bacterium]|nr:hypothetical protein [Rhabdochlamydiaceae bacterium]
MLRSQEEILADLDSTLDQLIQNAEVVCESDLCVLDSLEIDSMQKTQESLLARFAHTQEEISPQAQGKRYDELHKKLERLGELQQNFMNSLAKSLRPRIGRNRKKSKLRQFAKRTI